MGVNLEVDEVPCPNEIENVPIIPISSKINILLIF
jgi:hypothetical protein